MGNIFPAGLAGFGLVPPDPALPDWQAWPAGLFPGIYDVNLSAGPGSPVAVESSSIVGQPSDTSALPDLRAIVTLGASSVVAGDVLSVSALVINDNPTPAGASTTKIYLSHDATIDANDTLLETLSTPALTQGQSIGSDFTTGTTGLAPGTYYIIEAADVGNVVTETDETNNVVARSFVVTGVDLAVTNITLNAPSVAAGELEALNFTVENIGGAPAGASTARLYLSSNATLDANDTLLGAFSTDPLSPNSANDFFTSAAIPAGLAPGTYYIIAAADSDHVVTESNETNNVVAQSFTVTANQAPALTESFTSLSINAGTSIGANALFTGSDAENDLLTYYLYDNTSAAGSGHFVVNGTVVPAGPPYTVTEAQLGQTKFVAGAKGASDDIIVAANDGQHYSNLIEFHINALNNAPVMTAPSANVAIAAGQSIAASSLFSATDADNDPLSYYLFDNTLAINSGHFVVNGTVVPAGTPYLITAAQLAQTSFVALAAGFNDDLIVSAYDGTALSNNVEIHVKADTPPVLTAMAVNFSTNAGQSISAANLFSGTDIDGDQLTYFLFDNTSAANSGHFLVNGTVVPAGTAYTVTAAQLAQTTFVAGAGGVSDDLLVSASDGKAASNLIEFHVNAINHAPTLTGPNNVAAFQGFSIPFLSFVTGNDVDNDPLTYFLYDNTPAANSGHFVVNGVVVPAGAPYTVTSAQLAQTTFVMGAAGGSDDVLVSASDGLASSNLLEIHFNTIDRTPVLTAPSANVSVAAGQSIAASTLFSATDADGDSLTYYVFDNTSAANSGHFLVNGTVVAAGSAFPITAAQLAQATFVAGSAGVSDDLIVLASDGHANSSNVEFHVNADNPPVLSATTLNFPANTGQAIPASSLFSATDVENDTLSYYLFDNTPAANSGHFSINGNVVAAGTAAVVTAAQLAQTTFVAGAPGTTDDLLVTAFDGKAFSNHIEFNFVTINHAPVVTVPNAGVQATAGQSIAASTLFSASDLDGDALTYYLFDNTSAANSGHFSVNGTTVPAGASYQVTAAQLAQTSFVAGTAGSNDDLIVLAYDGNAFSNHAEFHVFV